MQRAGAHLADRRCGDQPRSRPPGHERGRDHDVEVGHALLERAPAVRPAARASAPSRSRPRSPRRGRRDRGTWPRATRPAPSPPGRTSNAETTAPSRRAVAIACRPATPAPSTSTFAGATVPAAVISSGNIFWHAVGGDQHGLVARHGRLRRERVHRLGARDSRDRLHRERDHALRGAAARCPRRRVSGARKPISTVPGSSRRDLVGGGPRRP